VRATLSLEALGERVGRLAEQFGFTDFVLCLRYKGEAIKHFFLTYGEAMATDFVLTTEARRSTFS
jgi:NDP-sugar pyrophosphorylase family protein